MDLSHYVKRIAAITHSARSEAKLEGDFNHVLKDCLAEWGIDFDPHVNETLKSMGLSQVDASRPDGVFGHIVYDYKVPGTLSSSSGLQAAKRQLEGYLDSITGGHESAGPSCRKWLGYVCDGRTLAYCRSDSHAWQWLRPLPISENTLLFLVHAYRSLNRKPLTAELLSITFGKESEIARNLIREMCRNLSAPHHRTNMLFREWRRLFEQISTYELEQLPSLYAWADENSIVSDNTSQLLFALHSYYSIVVKLLTSELLAISTPQSVSFCENILAASTTEELYRIVEQIEDGEHYRRYRISNFLEGDFFSWYVTERSEAMCDGIRELAREFLEFEPASAVLLPDARQDLLKQFYTALVDEQIRHDLGEYYTPDWLAQHLLDRAHYDGDVQTRVLDPACGSGTFLVEAIQRLRRRCEEVGLSSRGTLYRILVNVKGLDLNPLAVISARANYILCIYDLVAELGHDVEVPVYLADSINVPVEKRGKDGLKYFEYSLETELERFVLEIPENLVRSQVIGQVLLVCEEGLSRGQSVAEILRAVAKDEEVQPQLSEPIIEKLRQFVEVMKSLEDRDWNGIWCRILRNNFSPSGFGRFDLVVGNPPWVRWSRLPVSYRQRVKAFCDFYGLVSGQGYSGGIETDISTVVAFSSADNWLDDGGVLALLITWTVFKSKSARGFRIGRLPGGKALRTRLIEDLTDLRPFPDAENETAIYVAEKVPERRRGLGSRVPCRIWSAGRGARRVAPSTTLKEVYRLCNIEEGVARPIGELGSPYFTGSDAQYRASVFLRGTSEYLNTAHRGTVTDCARVYWVNVLRYSPTTNRALIRTLTAKELPKARMVDPVEGAWIEADLLYPLLRGRSLGRYSTKTTGWYHIVPNQHYDDVQTESDFAAEFPLAYSYFQKYEPLLKKRASYRRYQGHLPFYVVYCVGQYTFSRYKVVWMEQQKPALFRAAVVSDEEGAEGLNVAHIPDHKLYFASLETAMEAHYLCGVLNSGPVRNWLGGFLLGKQIGTAVLEYTRIPEYDPQDRTHREIATISAEAHEERVGSWSTDTLAPDVEGALARRVEEVCS